MADKDYVTVVGFIQFDPQTREVNGRTVRDITVKSSSGQHLVRITIWDGFEGVPLEKGDFIAVDGTYTSNVAQTESGEERTYHNISANTLLRLQSAPRKETTATVNTQRASGSKTPF